MEERHRCVDDGRVANSGHIQARESGPSPRHGRHEVWKFGIMVPRHGPILRVAAADGAEVGSKMGPREAVQALEHGAMREALASLPLVRKEMGRLHDPAVYRLPNVRLNPGNQYRILNNRYGSSSVRKTAVALCAGRAAT